MAELQAGDAVSPPLKKNIKKRKMRKGLKILLIGLGALLVFLVAAAEITSSSRFCNACHYMKPFYKSWQESSHRNIPCSTCHYPSGLRGTIKAKFEGLVMLGRYWTKLYLKSRPWAEISDANCLKPGCHDKRLLQGQVRFKKIIFDHQVHLTDLRRGKQLRCTSCHSQIVQGKHIIVTESTCFICHFKKSEAYPRIDDCRHCHERAALTSPRTSRYDHSSVFARGLACNQCHANTVIGRGTVPRENCFKCHFEPDRLEKINDTDLMHRQHITAHKIECDQCHLEIQHRIVRDLETIADCQACHRNTHLAQKILYTGQGGGGLSGAKPNIMLEKGLSCRACHIYHAQQGGPLLKSDTLTARAQACESCHEPGFARLAKTWEDAVSRKLAEILPVLVRAQSEVRRAPRAKSQAGLFLLREAAFNIEVVDKGKSVHNVSLSQDLLSAAYAKIREALRLCGSAYRPPPSALAAAQMPVSCANCHTGIEDIRNEIWGLSFAHRPHLINQKMACAQCHSNARRHGELIVSKSGCAPCHHGEVKKDCADCHLLQNTLYRGGTLPGWTMTQDSMSEAGVACPNCHLDGRRQVIRPQAGKCVECHEEGTRRRFEEWQKETAGLLGRLEAALAEKKKIRLSDTDKAEVDAAAKLAGWIRMEGSLGAHNFEAVRALLKRLLEKIDSLVPGQGS